MKSSPHRGNTALGVFTGAKKGTCSVVLNPKVDPDPTPCSLSDVATKLQNEKFKFKVDSGPVDHLVLTSRRLGALQLRSVPGKPDTNMLNSAPESSQGPRRLLQIGRASCRERV